MQKTKNKVVKSSQPKKSKVAEILNEISTRKFDRRLEVNPAFTYPQSELNDNPTIGGLIKEMQPITENVTCLDVLKLFQKDLTLFAIPVVTANRRPIGIVERNNFVELFVQPYTIDLFGRIKITEFMNQSPLIVDKETTIDDVARMMIDAGMQHMMNGFIATKNDAYLGVANGLDLLNEITLRKQNHLFHLAHFDQLTKLPNRTLFLDRLTMAITRAGREQTRVGLIFIDLDNFKNFNDSLGHSVGDQILIEAATRLSSCARESDTVARLSGDEFTIILNNVNDDEDIKVLCTRILKTLNLPLKIMGREMFITASLGFAIYPQDDQDMTGLLVKADAAMYEAKRSGRNTYRQYLAGMNLYSIDHMSLEMDLRLALDRKEFQLFYQPQVVAKTGEVVGNEALIRWHHPSRGILTPVHFVEILEKTGLIINVGQWVLQEACKQQMQWVKSGLSPMSISVNISVAQFFQPDFCELVESTITDSGINPQHLVLELTESLCMSDAVIALKNMHRLHNLGVKLAIDDFGTGYSNLSYLKKFPIDSLKIDQSFIRSLEQEPINVEIVKAIIALGKSMALELVAEGVETENEMQLIKSCGCDFIQGYLFSKPMPADELEPWLSVYNDSLTSKH